MNHPPVIHPVVDGRGSIKFTRGVGLLEILIVIAIISILAVLVAPTLRSAIESADSATCLSNLRQIGIAARLYGAEHNGTIVPTYYLSKDTPEGVTSGGVYWTTALAPYLGGEASKEVYRCPTSVKVHEEVRTAGCTYSLNAYICPHHASNREAKVHRYVETATPGKIIFAAHGAWLSRGSYGSNMTYGRQSPEPLHRGKSNILFLDGHAETLPPSTYLQFKYWLL